MTSDFAREAFHTLAANMTPKPLDMIVHAEGNALNIIAASEINQKRLVGSKGQNVNALKRVAEWLGFTSFRLAEPNEEVTGKGTAPRHPNAQALAGLDTDNGARAFFHGVVLDLFAAAGLNRARADIATDTDASEIQVLVDLDGSGTNRPEPLTVDAIAKTLRAIAVLHGWGDLDFQCI